MTFKRQVISVIIFFSFAGLMLADTAPAYGQIVYQIQRKLNDLGYDPGPLDGIWGKKTEEAVKAFQRDKGLAARGIIDQETKAKLDLETPPSQKSLHETGSTGSADRLTTAGPRQKVGYINLQRLVNESRMGQTARNDFQKMRQEKEALVAAKLREVNAIRKLIEKTGDKMSPQEKREKQLALQKTNKEYQRMVADVKEDILLEDRELVSIILQKADEILNKVAKRLNYAVILKDATAIGYLDPGVDITDEVIKELNKK